MRERAEGLRSLDVFSKPKAAIQVKTKTGAFLSLVCVIVMVSLFTYELSSFIQGEIVHDMVVDQSVGGEVEITLDVTFPALPCIFLSVNSMDKLGNYNFDLSNEFYLTRLDPDGLPVSGTDVSIEGANKHAKETDVDLAAHVAEGADKDKACGDCYGAETPEHPCCNTCKEVEDAYHRMAWDFSTPQNIAQCVAEHYLERMEAQKHEGCHVKGMMKVGRVNGNFNIVPGKFIQKNARYAVDSKLYEHIGGVFNMSHTINHLSFGQYYPGMSNSLDRTVNIYDKPHTTNMIEYFVKIVPTTYMDMSGYTIHTNQFSAVYYSQDLSSRSFDPNRANGIPGLFVLYDMSPVTVRIRWETKPFLHFITQLCAVIGGIYTIFNILDSIYYSGIETLKHKMMIGKDY